MIKVAVRFLRIVTCDVFYSAGAAVFYFLYTLLIPFSQLFSSCSKLLCLSLSSCNQTDFVSFILELLVLEKRQKWGWEGGWLLGLACGFVLVWFSWLGFFLLFFVFYFFIIPIFLEPESVALGMMGKDARSL